MKIEYLNNIKSDYLCDKMIRIFDFTSRELKIFHDLIHQEIIINNKNIDLVELDFIQQINCKLELRIGVEDLGIVEVGNGVFVCELTILEYIEMTKFISPIIEDNSGYQFIVEPISGIEFLLSYGGGW